MRKLLMLSLLTVVLGGFVGRGAAQAAPALQGGSLPTEVTSVAWELISLQPAGGTAEDVSGGGITMNFGSDGRVSGSGGCNNYNSSFTAGAGQALSFGPAASTLRLCEEPANSRESAFYQALNEISSYSLDGGNLVLRSDAGAELIFSPGAAAAPAPAPTPPATLPSTGGNDLLGWVALMALLLTGAGLGLRTMAQRSR
ncbi:MAG: META domain-containing protein [Oscillochloridaceae bacterium umkhey_bin13]